MNVIQAEMERHGISQFNEMVLVAAVMASFGGKIHLNDFHVAETWELYTEDLIGRRHVPLQELIDFLGTCTNLYGFQGHEVRRANRIDVAFARSADRERWNWDWFFSILCRRLRSRDEHRVSPWFRIARKGDQVQLVIGCPYVK